ncbi:MAG TPA: hypothetical protein VF787_21815 [Thermoanaerobaculia bacterium]
MRYALLLTLFCTLSVVAEPNAEALRARGPAVLDELKDVDDATLDQICAQKDCRFSRLYWFTDLDAAKAEAHRKGKPILSLRLLGRLDEEVSCANSRFFRTILYPDPSIAPLLREDFVLHWESVRAVPTITIELGDGRVIRQTITGNSAHYLLDANGRVLDVLPGMVSPAAYRAQLLAWRGLNESTDLRAYHGRALTQLIGTRSRFMAVPAVTASRAQPTAKNASRLAMTKSLIEAPVLTRLDPKASLRELPQAMWDSIGEGEKSKVVFSEPALELMARKQPITEAMLDQLRASIAADTILNQEELHYRIHEWFVYGNVSDFDSLNKRVYAELFLTPLDDPWMGLKPATVFAALQE